MPEKQNSVTKPFTLQTFMKTATDLNISSDTVEDFIRTLDDLVKKITKKAEEFTLEGKRKTIIPEDLDKALDEILGQGPLTVDELIQKIEPLAIPELGDLSKKLKKLAEDLSKPKAKVSSKESKKPKKSKK